MITSKTNIYIAIATIICSIGIFISSIPALANTNSNPDRDKPAIVNLTGTIRKLAVEGTCYQLATDDGKNYELMGKFPKRDGAKVQVSGTISTDIVTICQVGKPFKVKSVRVIK
ncbi:MAG: hypothetical protein RLZZ135_2744 [Cyanobacteriota bacterium]|jgi:polyferredoxin